MTSAELLTMLKANLSIASTVYDEYLGQLLTAAKAEITREGITIADDIPDGNLQVMYAAYLFRKRAEDNPIMPRMLRYALNNRLFAQKMSEVTST